MRNIPIPVDVTRLSVSVAKGARPRLVSKETGEVKRDRDGNVMYEVTLMVEDEFGRMELVKVSVTPEPQVSAGDEVIPVGLVGYVWEQAGRWGISYRAQSFTPVTAAAGAGVN
ncbi:SCO3933 family regulatory protein [Microtetraspora malaysiensis]|uniref:Regulatory protein n=1 Tax=Microtetraspora malaysiensis TaxID=161358 RepID=A0ABW6SW91_9ACTN